MSTNGDIDLVNRGGTGVDATPILISAEELARLMRVSERTLWRLLSAGKVPQPVRIGRSTRWRYAEVREWIEKGCPGPSPRA
jgi:excisionase family DNA binding protein